MQVGAVLVLGSASDNTNARDDFSFLAESVPAASSCHAPLAMLDLLGEPVLYRIIESLHRSGVGPIFLLINSHSVANSTLIRNLGRSCVHVMSTPKNGLGEATQATLASCRQRGLRAALVMRASAYVELDAADMFRFHCAARQPITFVRDSRGRLEIAMIDCLASDTAMAFLAEGCGHEARARDYAHGSYASRLCTPRDLRRLAQDALARHCRIRPNGVEVRPGVWIAESARLHPLTRVVGPAYVGSDTRLRAGVLITRSTSIERDCEVDSGCTIENATILSGTYLGVGLEIAHAILDRNRLIDLRRSVEVEIDDSGLIGPVSVRSRAWLCSLARSIWPATLRPSAWRPLVERLGHFLSARPVPTPSQFLYGDNKPWPMFDNPLRAVNFRTSLERLRSHDEAAFFGSCPNARGTARPNRSGRVPSRDGSVAQDRSAARCA